MMKGKPDVEAFLNGVDPENQAQSIPTKAAATAPENRPEPTVQKLFRLRRDTANALRMEAAKESVAQGRRVTETEIVEGLIRVRFGLPSR
ncbi:hypothetical protein JKG47_04690 [Acidithiobacillus sp. MC6.1]|nr:hypothetical protein [Acidithiobacillus sp. MC6.1]